MVQKYFVKYSCYNTISILLYKISTIIVVKEVYEFKV